MHPHLQKLFSLNKEKRSENSGVRRLQPCSVPVRFSRTLFMSTDLGPICKWLRLSSEHYQLPSQYWKQLLNWEKFNQTSSISVILCNWLFCQIQLPGITNTLGKSHEHWYMKAIGCAVFRVLFETNHHTGSHLCLLPPATPKYLDLCRTSKWNASNISCSTLQLVVKGGS